MRFPKELITNNRKIYPSSEILSFTLMYARHKPGSDWKPEEDYPDFRTIKTDQSFNWSAYSIPIWTKFNPNKEFLEDYGVVGYSVDTIKNIHQYDSLFLNKDYDVIHDPIPDNYSHSELSLNLSKAERRSYRLLLKNGCIRKIYPNTNPTYIENKWEYFLMLLHRGLVKLSSKLRNKKSL